MAAYGTHPSITSADDAGRQAGGRPRDRRPAADGRSSRPTPVTSCSAHAAPGRATDYGGKTTTGLDDVDLWVGGLAEVTNLFGGLLGTTFNYVFQTQLEKLQDGDRLYYLARTPGMNLRTQLEGNSFSELIERNTDGTNTLKADAFATADCKFQLGATWPAPRRGFADPRLRLVADDPTHRLQRERCCSCASRTARSSTRRDQQRRPVRHQRPVRLQRHRHGRPRLRRQRQRHVLGQRRRRHPRGQRRRRRHARRRRQRHRHRPERCRRAQGRPWQRRHSTAVSATTS